MQKLLFFLFIILPFTLTAQNDPYQINYQYPKEEMLEDFDVFWESIQKVHPSLYDFISKDSLTKIVELERASLKSEGELYLYKSINRILSHIGCGHTVCLPSENWYTAIKTSNSIISMTVKHVNGDFYIWNHPFEDSLALRGLKIKSINNVPTTKITTEILAVISGEGNSKAFPYHLLQKSFRSYYTYTQPAAKEHSVEYYLNDSTVKEIIFPAQKPIKASPEPDKSALGFQLINEGKGVNYYLNDSESKTALIDINSFNRSKFKKFYKATFKSIKENKVKNLIIDLRNNGGGYFPHGNELLTYLLDEDLAFKIIRNDKKVEKSEYMKMPFVSRMTKRLFNSIPDKTKTDGKKEAVIKYKTQKKYVYRGNIYVLINGGSFSMSCYVASNLRQKTKAFFIGEETGGGKYGSNAILFYNLTLPNTQVRAFLPHYFCSHQYIDFEKGYGVLPDLQIDYSMNDYLENNDIEMQAAMATIKMKQ